MSLKKLLNEKKMTLIVSLPQNSVEFAKAAFKGGADAIKVHANVLHQASGNNFGSLAEQKEVFREIIKEVRIPVGLVPGAAEGCISEEEVRVVEEMGFSFFSMFAHFMPLYIAGSQIEKMVAITEDYDIFHVKSIDVAPVDVVEADVMPDDRHERIYLSDILKYRRLVENQSKPVVVPTQRIIAPSEVKYLYQIGVKGMMIGAIVTGKTCESIEKVTYTFREAIEKL